MLISLPFQRVVLAPNTKTSVPEKSWHSALQLMVLFVENSHNGAACGCLDAENAPHYRTIRQIWYKSSVRVGIKFHPNNATQTYCRGSSNFWVWGYQLVLRKQTSIETRIRLKSSPHWQTCWVRLRFLWCRKAKRLHSPGFTPALTLHNLRMDGAQIGFR